MPSGTGHWKPPRGRAQAGKMAASGASSRLVAGLSSVTELWSDSSRAERSSSGRSDARSPVAPGNVRARVAPVALAHKLVVVAHAPRVDLHHQPVFQAHAAHLGSFCAGTAPARPRPLLPASTLPKSAAASAWVRSAVRRGCPCRSTCSPASEPAALPQRIQEPFQVAVSSPFCSPSWQSIRQILGLRIDHRIRPEGRRQCRLPARIANGWCASSGSSGDSVVDAPRGLISRKAPAGKKLRRLQFFRNGIKIERRQSFRSAAPSCQQLLKRVIQPHPRGRAAEQM